MASPTTETKIDVKRAVAIAIEYLRELIPTIAKSGISLEEVELDGHTWLVTLGFTDKYSTGLRAMNSSGRAYKQFRIDSRSGAVSSMRIRNPYNAADA